MKKLSLSQKKVIADILGNLANAWISIGLISQIVFEMKNISMAIVSFFVFVVLFIISVKMVK